MAQGTAELDPTDPDVCNIFVSRREEEGEFIGRQTEIRDELIVFSSGRLRFWDMSDIEEGEDWREAINRELEVADILMLVLTKPAKKDFDWPIYEAGRFGGLNGGKIVCIYPLGEHMPDTLGNIQGVEADLDSVVQLLLNLYHKPNFSGTIRPLNSGVNRRHLEPIAEKICAAINGRTADDITEAQYVNPVVQLLLSREGAAQAAKAVDEESRRKAFADAELESNRRTLRTMFRLRPQDEEGRDWTWGQLEESAALADDAGGYNLLWMRELEEIMSSYLNKRDPERQIESGYLAKDNKVWQPEIEKFRRFGSGRVSIDVTFSPQPHRTWLRGEDEPSVGLAMNIMIGSRIRQEVIDPITPSLLAQWRTNEASRTRGFDELGRTIRGVERDGFFVHDLTHNSLSKAFTDPQDIEDLAELDEQFRAEIAVPLHTSLAQQDVAMFGEALAIWKANNAKFLKIGLRQYARIHRIE